MAHLLFEDGAPVMQEPAPMALRSEALSTWCAANGHALSNAPLRLVERSNNELYPCVWQRFDADDGWVDEKSTNHVGDFGWSRAEVLALRADPPFDFIRFLPDGTEGDCVCFGANGRQFTTFMEGYMGENILMAILDSSPGNPAVRSSALRFVDMWNAAARKSITAAIHLNNASPHMTVSFFNNAGQYHVNVVAVNGGAYEPGNTIPVLYNGRRWVVTSIRDRDGGNV